ncbi:uncharacterized protein LOC116292464 [Actinia tenebrosa]|uniref:Uncharacterized protein LOC116292464 n=1 Tax=Actinia tenebrosa TaxID=6105 RepID=A0A6P8HL40_ACTTE|nr:uncharacterized protein LOC116292464 [Actinia tenebrosa]
MMAIFSLMKQMALVLCIWSISLLVLTQAAKEKDDFRIFDRDFKPTSLQMHQMLRKANLESRGYTKESTTRIVTTGDTSTEIVTEFFYYKVVPCHNIPIVQKELSNLLPGVWKDDVKQKVRKITITKSLDDTNQCTAGIEIHFPKPSCERKAQASDTAASTAYNSREKRAADECAIWCLLCFRATSED